jgi:anti-sigma factor (TIGR02949 family)
MSERTRDCEWTRDRLDAFVDGELAADERDAVRDHCASCDTCSRELEMAGRIRDELHAFPALDAPAGLVEAAERAAAAANHARVVPLRRRRVTEPVRRTAIIAAAVTLIGVAVWVGVRDRATREPQASEADVRRATAEVALAFGYVDHYGDHAADIVRDDVIGKRVMPRIERALSAAQNPAAHDAIVPGLKRAVRARDVTSPPPDRS